MQIKTAVLILALLGWCAAPASAQTQKFGTIDLRKVFDGFWKTKQADANLKEEAAGLEKERKSLVEQYQKGQENYKKLLETANDPALATEEREKRKKAAEDELVKLKELQNNVEQFERQARTTLGEKHRRMRDNILIEIKDVIKARAKLGNYFLVFDTASESANNTPVVVYSNGDNDLTEVILIQLNTSAPPGLLKPDSETKPGAAEPGLLAPAPGKK